MDARIASYRGKVQIDAIAVVDERKLWAVGVTYKNAAFADDAFRIVNSVEIKSRGRQVIPPRESDLPPSGDVRTLLKSIEYPR